MKPINVAAVCTSTRALGPGCRAVVWVQGCPLDCAGCVSPEWIPDQPGRAVLPVDLVDELLVDPLVEGLTFSGGEPMSQAGPLAEVIREARRHRDLSLVCFTGFRLERLLGLGVPGAVNLLAEVDVLIDGPYVARLNDGRGLRGSRNQRVHHLSDRLRNCGYDFLERPRDAEIHLSGPSALLVGVPPPGVAEAFERTTSEIGRVIAQRAAPAPHLEEIL